MSQKNLTFIAVVIVLIGAAIFFGIRIQRINEAPPWLTYRNADFGFEFQYPPTYAIVTDENGWPNAVALLIPKKGAQAYYAAVEIWDTQDGFKNDYKHPHDPAYIFYKNDKYITFNYVEDEMIMQKILASFKQS